MDVDTLFVVRHCAVDSRLRGVGRGVLDYPLSPEGEAMSARIAAHLRGKVDTVITTGRRRTKIIGDLLEPHGVTHVVERRFQELHIPPAMPWEEFCQNHPEDARRYGQDIDALAFPSGERPEQVRNRVLAAWQEWSHARIRRLAIIAHDTSNQWLLAHLRGDGDSAPSAPQALGGIIEVAFDGARVRCVHEQPCNARIL